MSIFRSQLLGCLALFGATSCASAAIGTWNGSWPPPGAYNSSADANAPISATVQESPAKITLTLHRSGQYTIYRRVADSSEDWGTAIANLPAASTSYADTNVVVGTRYEYKVVIEDKAAQSYVKPTGYIMAGIKVDRTAPKGRVVVLVTDTIVNNLPEEFQAYCRDLGADGWTVHTIQRPPAANYSGLGKVHIAVREEIKAIYNAYPGELKTVVILGKFPIVRSGLAGGLRPDGHANSYAEACDSYYAEMDGDWKDVGSNNQTGDIGNVADDGKFDHCSVSIWLPSPLGAGQRVELGYGRVDTSFYQTSEIEGTRMYLQKLARYRRAADDFQPGRKGAIRRGYDNVDETGWMTLPGIVGPGKVTTIGGLADLPSDPAGRQDPDGLITRDNAQGPFLFYFKGSTDLGKRDDGGKAVFLTGMQSHWGWWAEGNGSGQMISRLGTDNYTLSVTWSIWGLRYLYHRLGMDGDISDVMRATINLNSRTEANYSYGTANIGNGEVNNRLWINHMGDPTIRLFPVRPPQNLAATASGGAGVNLGWTNSDDTNLVGVHIYRAPSPTGPWTRLTTAGAPITGTTFSDTPPSAGEWTYSVRAVKLETTAGGTYYNPSLGALATVETGTATAPLAITTASLSPADWQTKSAVSLKASGGNKPYTWSLVSGSLPPGLTISPTGLISGTPTGGGSTYYPAFQVTDFRGQTAQITYELGVSTRRIVNIQPEADSMVKSSVSYAPYNFGMSTGLTLVSSANIAPLYTDSFAYLRFPISALAAGERLENARLRFTRGGGSTATPSGTVTASLLDDAADNWAEGNIGGGTASGSMLTYNNRPTALSSRVTPTVTSSVVAPNGPLTVDFFPHVLDTLQYDAALKVGVQIKTNISTELHLCSRENPPAARPTLELEITHAPLITFSRPLGGAANIPSGQGIILQAAVTDLQSVTNQWSFLSGPGSVTFADANSAVTAATFTASGDYTLLFTSNDGTLVSQQTVKVRVLTNGQSSTENLVLYYRLEEATGATATDSAPDGVPHTGTLNDLTGTTWSPTSGKFGGGLNYPGSNRYIQIPDSDSLDNTNRLSIAFWVNPTSGALDGNSRGLLSKRSSANVQEAYSVYMISGRVYVRFNGTNVSINTTNVVLTANKWTHIAAIYDGTQSGTAGCVKIYINGTAVPLSGGNETDSSIPNTTSELWIGHLSGGSNTYSFNGLLDEVRIYRNRALTASDVGDLLFENGAQDAPRLLVNLPATNPTAGTSFPLSVSVTDDGIPSATVATQWSKVTGIPGISFTNATAASTNATADSAGALTLRVTADDGGVTTFADANIIINAALPQFATWATQISWPAGSNSTVTGDPDRDGYSNLLEYAFGCDPLAADPAGRLPQVSNSGNRVAITFTRDPALTHLAYQIEASSDLNPGSWTPIATASGSGTTANVSGRSYSITENPVGNLRRVTVVDNATIGVGAQRFLRVRVTEP